MFNKPANTPPARPPQAAPVPPVDTAPQRAAAPASSPAPAALTPRALSVLGRDLVFEGAISGDGELHVEGVVRGDLNIARLTVGEQAQVEGTIRGATVEVRGRVMGNIEAKAVKLYQSAHLEGDIVHDQLSIDAGAFFQGRCSRLKRAPVAPVLAPAPAPAPTAQVIELDTNAAGSAA